MLPTRIVAAVLALLSVVPLWRLLPMRATGVAGSVTAEQAAVYSSLVWSGVLLALIPAVIAALVLDTARFDKFLARAAAPLARMSAPGFAALAAVIATALAWFVATGIMRGQPTLIDSFAQLLHARFLAAGHLAGPLSTDQPFYHIQQTIATTRGWVSQYPPGYIALLALGFTLHSVTFVGPLAFGVAVFFTALIAEEVFPNSVIARCAGLLAALSPFMLGQAGAYMSHVPACAFSAMALYFVLRASRGRVAWSGAAGAAIGVLFTIRPLTGIVAGIVALIMSGASATEDKPRRIALAIICVLPFLIAVGSYNAHFFGAPTRFGYTAALGSHAGLGFGVDPWGNKFGVVEALAYTTAELSALNVFLLETPLPLVLFVGLYFALPRALTFAQRLLFWWVAGLVIANLFYWHHGLFMGPRMLADAGTLWVLLVVLSVTGLIRSIRADWLIAEKYSVRAFATGGAAAALVAGLLLLAPQRLLSYGPPANVIGFLRAPKTAQPTLVFVHGGWTTRIAMKLAAYGMSLDSVETALRQNGTCTVHNYALDYAQGKTSPIHLDFTARSDNLPRSVQVSPGNRIRIADGESIDAGCRKEIGSDKAGVIDVSPYLWQGDLPGARATGAFFVRDLGLSENAGLIARHRDREPLMLTEGANGELQLQAYAPAAAAVWSSR